MELDQVELQSASRLPQNDLFHERLEAFMVKSLSDVKAFAERENRPFEETRRYVAEWHAKYLFQPQDPASSSGSSSRISQVHSILRDTSISLESLHATTGVHSLLLAVDPNNTADEGFLGGTSTGRDFWRSLRTGGGVGAKMFLEYCKKDAGSQNVSQAHGLKPTETSGSARATKAELNELARKALRAASGVRNAEMKWTQPDRLTASYGVVMRGWPPDIPPQNPSDMKLTQNRRLLALLKDGSLHFVKVAGVPPIAVSNESGAESSSLPTAPTDPDAEAFSWAIHYGDEDTTDHRN